MVAEDGNHSVGFVVRVEFLLDRSVVRSLFVKLHLESLRGVEGTENLGGEPLHVSVEVTIQLGGLLIKRGRSGSSNLRSGKLNTHMNAIE